MTFADSIVGFSCSYINLSPRRSGSIGGRTFFGMCRTTLFELSPQLRTVYNRLISLTDHENISH